MDRHKPLVVPQAESDSAQSTLQSSETPRLYRELQHLSKVLAYPGLKMSLGKV